MAQMISTGGEEANQTSKESIWPTEHNYLSDTQLASPKLCTIQLLCP